MLDRLKKIAFSLLRLLKRYFAFYQTGRWAKILFYLGLLIPFLLFSYLFVLLPLLNPVKLAEKVTAETSDVPAKLSSLKTDEMFLQTQLKLSKFDSINLAIDLIDSLAILQIGGVKMRECKIHDYHVNRTVQQLKRSGTFYSWLATPFLSQTDWSTIPKAPIKVKRAPKDTVEANKNIDTSKVILEKPDTFVTIQYDKGLVVEIRQQQWPTLIGSVKKLFYNLRLKVDEVRITLAAVQHPELPAHPIRIKIELQKNDVKAIYRALPRKSGLALRLKV
jgi:hypothetical protein